MEKSMKVNWLDNFEYLYKKMGQRKYGLRLLALWKIQSGETETAVCQSLHKTMRPSANGGVCMKKKGWKLCSAQAPDEAVNLIFLNKSTFRKIF